MISVLLTMPFFKTVSEIGINVWGTVTQNLIKLIQKITHICITTVMCWSVTQYEYTEDQHFSSIFILIYIIDAVFRRNDRYSLDNFFKFCNACFLKLIYVL